MMTLPETDLARALGRIEQQAATAAEDIDDLSKRASRTEDRVGHLERVAHAGKGELGRLTIVSRAAGGQLDDHSKRLLALEEPVEKAKAASNARRIRMRARIKQIGGVLVVIFGVVEWVAKPIVGFLAEQWVRGGSPPPGH